MNDLMLDMETWDTGREAAVRAIALADFDPGTGHIVRRGLIDARPSLDNQIELGRAIGLATVKWWHSQTPLWDLILPHKAITRQASSLAGIMECMEHFLAPMLVDGRLPGKVWTRGHFDCTILRHLWSTFDAEEALPWQYWQERDVRTLDCLVERIRPHRPHDPVSDIEAQIAQVHTAHTLAELARVHIATSDSGETPCQT